MKNKTNPFLSKKQLQELYDAEKKLLQIQKEINEAIEKIKNSQEKQEEQKSIIFLSSDVNIEDIKANKV